MLSIDLQTRIAEKMVIGDYHQYRQYDQPPK
jgi:hypothetical protein